MAYSDKTKTEKKTSGFHRGHVGAGSLAAGVMILLMTAGVCFGAAPKRVLILNSYHKGYAWTDNIVEGIESTLREQIENIELRVEYMDTKRIDTAEYQRDLFELLKRKFTGVAFDAAIVTDDNAFHFIREHRTDLIGDCPVVFMGVNHFERRMLHGHEGHITGIIQDADMPATIRIALKLKPETGQVAFIYDNTSTGRSYRKQVALAAAEFPDLEIIRLDGAELSTSELHARLRGLPETSIAILCIWLKGKDGVFTPVEKGYPAISVNTPVPLYGVLEPMLDHGILGGKIQSGKRHGTAAAEMALQILRGEKIADLPVRLKSPNSYMFDYGQLQRWGISKDQLPQGAVVINEPQSAYYRYRPWIWGAIAVFCTLGLLVIALGVNIVRRKAVEKGLYDSEQRFRTLVSNVPGITYRCAPDEHWTMEFISREVERLSGYPPEDFVNNRVRSYSSIIHSDDRQLAQDAVRRGIKNQSTFTIEYRIIRNDESVRWVFERGQVVFNELGEATHLDGVILDITDRRQAEQDLLENEENLRTTLNSIGDAVITTDTKGRVTRMNAVAEKLSGWTATEAIGRPLPEVFNIIGADGLQRADNPAQRVLAAGETISLANNTTLIGRNGESHQIADSGAPIRAESGEILGVVLVFRDVTEEALLQEQLRQSQKMEAIGQLAGGVAHDFNNLLAGIMGNAQLLEMKLDPDTKEAGFAQQIDQAAARAADLTGQLLAFSRKGKLQSTSIDVHALIDEVIALLSRSIDKRIDIRRTLQAEPSAILGDPTQLQNALLNLGVNARDAMTDSGGALTFATRTVMLDAEYCRQHSEEIPPGQYLQIDVSDTGMGMSAETQKRIFEPFYTTKAKGKGTGLGLAGVYGCIKSHHGMIRVESKPEVGTTFKLLLPVAEALTETEIDSKLEVPTRGHGCVLIVDDEEIVRNFAAQALQTLGYSVSTCTDGLEAVEFYRNHHHEIGLVILDLIMPNLSGAEAFEKLKQINPDVRVIVASGYTQNSTSTEMLENGALVFLSKPFRIDELSQLVAKHISPEVGSYSGVPKPARQE